MNIDICMPTKNSDDMLEECLSSIFDSDIPINNFYIVDAYSKDDTEKIAKRFDVEFIKKNLKLGKAREFMINELVETEWFAFIDSDVILPKNWFSEIIKYKEYGNALESWNWNWKNIQGFQAKETKNGRKFTTSYRKQSDRARTIATLIEHKYVKGIEIPKDLFILEDEYIRRYIEEEGGKWIKTGVKIDHYPPEGNAGDTEPYEFGYLYGKYDFHSFSKLLFKALGNMIIKNRPYSYYWRMIGGYLKGKMVQ